MEPDARVRDAMWEPLLVFLQAFPTAWLESEEEDEEEDEEDEAERELKTDGESHAKSEAYDEFLRFLALGCGGSPAQGYPAVVVVLATIPPSVSHALHAIPPFHIIC